MSDEAIAKSAIASSLKKQKEDFVSGLLGGPIEEIYYVTTIALTAYLSFSLISKYQPQVISFPIDFSLNAVAILLAITLYSDQISRLHLLVAIPGLLVYLSYVTTTAEASTTKKQSRSGTKSKSKSHSKKPAQNETELLPKKSFITAYRSHMLIITNAAILAVDFKVFPRRFAKVETWGTSLMDLGVGSFVFSMGLANSRSVIKQRFNSSNATPNYYKFKFSQYFNLITKNTIKSLPVLILGIIRLVSVKSLEYQEHASEYGIHWNFFMTLGLLPIFLGILDPLLNILPRFIVATLIGLGYDRLLMYTELQSFILRTDNRNDNLLTMNKEGIFSFLGYLSIFIFGQSFGSFVLTGIKTPGNLIKMCSFSDFKRNKSRGAWFTVTPNEGLFICTILFLSIFWFVQNSYLFANVSRRLANFPYVLMVVSYNANLLFGYSLVELFLGAHESKLLNAINNNGLFNFLIANLSTGLVNMTINTLKVSDGVSFGILLTYLLVLSVTAIVLDKKRIYIKL